MSIDLDIEISGTVLVAPLISGVTEVLRQLLRVEPPPVRIAQMANGKRIDAVKGKIEQEEAVYLLSFSGQDHEIAVTLIVGEEDGKTDISISPYKTREAPEYVLALASAIFVAIEFEVQIRDGFMFWTGEDQHDPQLLLEQLRVEKVAASFVGACQSLVGGRLG